MKIDYYEATKNFFVIFDFDSQEELGQNEDECIKILNRSGADSGLILLPSQTGSKKMLVLEKDGSYSAMCGNGIRATAKYIFDVSEGGVVPGDMITIEILDGVIEVEVISEDEFRVNMGRVVSFGDNPSDFVGRVTSSDFVDEGQLNPQVGNFRLFSIRQEPHLIVETDRNKFDIEKTYFEIKDCGYFPNSVNLNFIKIVDDNTVENLTCERGVDGITQSCGTGSTSIAQYMFERFGCDRLQVINKGGTLSFLRLEDGSYLCSGEAKKWFDYKQ